MKELMEILGEIGCCKLGDACGCAEKKDKNGSSTSMDKGIWDVTIKEDFKTVKTVENLTYSDMLIEKDKWSSLTSYEYKEVLNYLYSLDLQNGYIQELGNHEEEYVPDFNLTF